MKSKKGYVYFLKQLRMDAVKIGHTNQDDVMDRVNAFKTGSPYGVELIGYIETTKAKELERIIHEDLKYYRLEGEWFKIDVTYALYIIEQYGFKQDKKKRIKLDIPYTFNYENYTLFELLVFRKFFSNFKMYHDFDYELINDIVRKYFGISLSFLDAEELYDKYANIAHN